MSSSPPARAQPTAIFDNVKVNFTPANYPPVGMDRWRTAPSRRPGPAVLPAGAAMRCAAKPTAAATPHNIEKPSTNLRTSSWKRRMIYQAAPGPLSSFWIEPARTRLAAATPLDHPRIQSRAAPSGGRFRLRSRIHGLSDRGFPCDCDSPQMCLTGFAALGEIRS